MKQRAEDVLRALIDEAGASLDSSLEKIRHCVEQLSEEQVWWRPAEGMNAIGNLLLHLSGNVRQWIVSGLGGAADVRNRPGEFAERQRIARGELLGRLEQVIAEAKGVLSRMTAEGLMEQRRIQGFEVTGIGVLFSVVPHFQGHTQEIICLTRMQLGDAYKFHWKPKTAEERAG